MFTMKLKILKIILHNWTSHARFTYWSAKYSCNIRYVSIIDTILKKKTMFLTITKILCLYVTTHNFALNMKLRIVAIGRSNCERLLCKWGSMFPFIILYLTVMSLRTLYYMRAWMPKHLSRGWFACWKR